MSKQLVQIQYGQEENNLLDVCVTNAYKDAKDNQIDTTYATKEENELSKTTDIISGNNPTVTNSANAPLIYLKNSGYTEQETLSGKNLCDLSTVTDGYMVAFETGYNYESANHFVTDYIEVEADTVYTMQGFLSGLENWFYDEDKNPINSISSTTFTTPSNCKYIKLSALISDKGKQQVELGDTATEYEPYCGGVASPNPDYPQDIVGLAGTGYFDGALRQGGYKFSNGSYMYRTDYVCNINEIPCNAGDTLSLEYNDTTIADMGFVFYNESGEFISSVYTEFHSGTTKLDATAPDGTAYCYFDISSSSLNNKTITPATAKYVSVTINGKYAVINKTCGKNLLRPTLKSITQTGVDVIIEEGKVKMQGAATTATFIAIADVYLEKGKTYKFVSQEFSGGNLYVTDTVQYKNTTFTWEKSSNYYTVTLYIFNGQTVDAEITPMITDDINTTIDDFEPYQETTASIPIDSPLYEGDYIEVYADGSGKLVRENIDLGASRPYWYNDGFVGTGYRYSFGLKHKGYNTPMYSTHFKQASKSSYSVVGDYIENRETLTKVSVRTTSNDLSTVEKFNAWLQENNVKILVKLATPIETLLTAEQVQAFKQLYTFDNVTNFFCDGEITARYYVNTDSGDTVGMLQGMIPDIEAGENVVIEKNDNKITISSTDTKYTHPTTSGNKHIPSGGSSGQILRWAADGTAVWGADNSATKAEVSTLNEVLTSRMDSFTKLEEGSTTGDAELVDARIDYKGTTYENVGAHIREATSQLSNELSQYHDLSYKFGMTFPEAGSYYIPCDIKEGDTYAFTNKGSSSISIVSLATDKDPSSTFQEIATGFPAGATYGFRANANAKYVYISWVAGVSEIEFIKQNTKISNIDTNIANNTALINTLNDDVSIYHNIAYKINRKIDKADGYWIEADIVKNKSYAITNCGSGNISLITLCTAKETSSEIQKIAEGLKVGTTYGFTAEADANYIYVSYIDSPTEIEIELLTPDCVLTHVYTIGEGDSFIDTLEEATKFNDSVIYVSGKHDLYQEYLDKYGADYFENYEYDWPIRGPLLKNNVTIYFSGNSLLTFHYPGDNEDVKFWFSPLNSDKKGFTMYNLQLECSNCRYGIHDERGGMSDEYHNHYYGGYIKIDNTKNDINSDSRCIGGGLGANGEIHIEGMKFVSVQSEGANNNISVDYHNDSVTDDGAKSSIVFNNNYIEGDFTFGIRYIGKSTEITRVICSGNSVGLTPYMYQSEASATTVNMELNAWNNTVRN